MNSYVQKLIEDTKDTISFANDDNAKEALDLVLSNCARLESIAQYIYHENDEVTDEVTDITAELKLIGTGISVLWSKVKNNC